MLLNDLLDQKDNNKVINNPELFVEFSRRTVRFGDSIYQLRNITGFTVGKIPKPKLQILPVLVLIVGGIFLLRFVIGFFLIAGAIWILYSHFMLAQKYGFMLHLNSGEIISFISNDRDFLIRIVSALYKLMEGDLEGVKVQWSNRSVNVFGEVRGVITTGNNVEIQNNI